MKITTDVLHLLSDRWISASLMTGQRLGSNLSYLTESLHWKNKLLSFLSTPFDLDMVINKYDQDVSFSDKWSEDAKKVLFEWSDYQDFEAKELPENLFAFLYHCKSIGIESVILTEAGVSLLKS